MARLIAFAFGAVLAGCGPKKVCDVVPAEATIGLGENTPEAKAIRDELQGYNDGDNAPPTDRLGAYCENKWRLVTGKYCKERVDQHCGSICSGADVAQCKGDGRVGFATACAKLSLQPFRDVMTRCRAATLDANNALVLPDAG